MKFGVAIGFGAEFNGDEEGEGRRVKEIREEMGLGEIFVKELWELGLGWEAYFREKGLGS